MLKLIIVILLKLHYIVYKTFVHPPIYLILKKCYAFNFMNLKQRELKWYFQRLRVTKSGLRISLVTYGSKVQDTLCIPTLHILCLVTQTSNGNKCIGNVTEEIERYKAL